MKKTDLKSMTEKEMTEVATLLGEKSFRGKQLYKWISKGIDSFGEMKNLPKAFLHELDKKYYVETLQIIKREISDTDGTRKYAFRLKDGLIIEAVFMKYKHGNSLCISSQAGCAMGCIFCASTVSGLERNLTSGEMVAELDEIEKDTGEVISNIVVMGIGEPMHNLENINRFIELVHDPVGRNISLRNITVSSCGIIPKLREFYERWPQVNIAISLHSPISEIRQNLMPIESIYGIDEILAFAKEYTKKTGRRITYEYALIADINDDEKQAELLGRKLKEQLCHVNLIPLNSTETGELKGSSKEKVRKFKEILERQRVPVTIRRTLGEDISGACGQLRLGLSDK